MAKSRKRSASSKSGPSAKRVTPSTRSSAMHREKRFPMDKIHELLERKFPSGNVKAEAAVFLTAVLEYLAIEILELSTNVARSRSGGKDGVKVTLQDMLQAIEADAETKELIDKVRQANASAK
ncbi:histone H2A [Caerostris darwini]|uniref:Histone H2A n=1 Tax=Caerostris darwini TaxID=1538125 RepID=A0AAV4U929_9ARAC|nr:histone H2A [Caerostris darwini]